MNFIKRLAKPVYAIDYWTLKDIYLALVKGPCEEICYATGPIINGVRVISRPCPLEYNQQSPVYVQATRKSSVNALIEMVEHENQLHLVAHSHPGYGIYATLPSGIDINYMDALQKSGAEAISLIVSRDKVLRFWSVNLPFKLMVLGERISKVKGHRNVYRIEIPETGQEQGPEIQGRLLAL